MRKICLRQEQNMSAAAFVDAAAEAANKMVLRESRGPGDILNAMRRLETRYGIPYATLWRLRYRRPKDILVSAYARIISAYDTECERQQRALDHERSIIEAKSGVAAAFVRAADALAGEED